MEKEKFSFIMAARLKEERKQAGLSHAKLREALKEKYDIDISLDSLKGYEVDQAEHTRAYANAGMRSEYLRCFADFYGVSTDYLLGLSDIRTRDETIQGIHNKTGLSVSAISYLQQLKDREKDWPFSNQWFEFYSAVICDCSIQAALLTLPAKIRRLDEYGFQNEQQEIVFDTAKQAKRFYEFELQSCIMKFINKFFENKTFI